MDDQEFFDKLYQLWSKTTQAENGFWAPREDQSFTDGSWEVFTEEGDKTYFVASFMTEEDANFLATMHGALPELVRRLQDAIDESDRLDCEKDELIAINAGLEMEIDGLKYENTNMRGELEALYAGNQQYSERITELESELKYWSNR
jgi:FtsZ-binding cell division protein ZapB